jgi:plasmid stabilization system protein ParE
MTFNIVVSKLASLEIEESIEFYESRQKGLGKEFIAYLRGYFSILKTNPEIFQIKRKGIFREIPLKKFPFIVIYEIHNKTVIIYSVFHTSRNPELKP